MAFQLTQPRPEHFDEMGRICHDAFRAFQLRHGFEPDFPSAAVGRQLIEAFSNPEHFTGFVALDDGKVVGSNFISKMDPVGGIGPITVDPTCQSKGVGKRLMQAVIEAGMARPSGMLRLMQDSHNVTSLSLYTSLGFEWRHAVAMMQLPSAAPGPTDGVRPMQAEDIDAVDRICQQNQKVSRRAEMRWMLGAGMPSVVRERNGKIVAFMTPGPMGHGAAMQIEDVLAMIAHLGKTLPPPMARFFCPLAEHDLHRALLRAGCRVLRVMNLMGMGAYEEPTGTWMPSILY